MLVENQMIEVKWTRKNKTFLIYRGYDFTAMGDSILVKDTDNPEKNDLMYIVTSCKNCRKSINKKISEFKSHGYHCCSRNCQAKIRMKDNNPNPKKDKVIVQCFSCDKKVEVFESVSKKNRWHFCSRKCYSEYRSLHLNGENSASYKGLTANCDTCNKEFSTIQYTIDNNKNMFCSQECYWEYRSVNYSGENHPHFGTKKTPEQIDKMRIITAKRISEGKFPQTNTSIQITTNTILERVDSSFEEEVQFKYYALDFYSKEKNLAIEVMGDYWHASPIKYMDYNSLHSIQKKDIKRDKSKETYLKKYHAINVLYLWETDIKQNSPLCEKLIKLYVDQEGILEDYNSFNYEIIGDVLKLKSQRVLPYFKRVNTTNQKVSL